MSDLSERLTADRDAENAHVTELIESLRSRNRKLKSALMEIRAAARKALNHEHP